MAWLKRKANSASPHRELRDVLFGDVPLAAWAGDGASEPWRQFAEASVCLTRRDVHGATDALIRVTQMPGLESRHYLQAWCALRSLNHPPSPETAKQLLGVVIELAFPRGLDVLATYDDHTIRYLNAQGGGAIWEHPNATLDSFIDRVLLTGRAIVARIGVWTGERRGPPPIGHARITLLTPSGPHFGEGPLDTLQRDALAGPALAAGAALLQQLTQVVAGA